MEEPAEIVVTGNPEREREARRFVEALAQPTRFDQLALFRRPVCPMAFGLRPAGNAAMTARLREVAAAAGVRLQPEGCAGDTLLFVTSDRPALIRLLHRERPELFGERKDKEIDALASEPGPAVAWQVIEPRGSDGRAMERVTHVQLDPRRKDRVDSYVLPQVSVSRIGVKIRVDSVSAAVLIDAEAVRGASITQIADYAAMRLFGSAVPPAADRTGPPTILALFDDRAGGHNPVPSLTEWDLGYLTGLYAIPDGYAAFQQQGRIATMIARGPAEGPRSAD